MGEKHFSKLTKMEFEIWRVTVLENFLPLKNYGMDIRFSGNNKKHRVSIASDTRYKPSDKTNALYEFPGLSFNI